MAAVSATIATPLVSKVGLSKTTSSPNTCSIRPAVGLPSLRTVQVSCSMKDEETRKVEPVAVGALAAIATAFSHPALALVDDRLSTEGTGLSLGVSNPILVWVLLGIAALIWALFFVYASNLKDDDDSGLAL